VFRGKRESRKDIKVNAIGLPVVRSRRKGKTYKLPHDKFKVADRTPRAISIENFLRQNPIGKNLSLVT